MAHFCRAQALPTTKIIAIIIPIDSRGVVDHFLLRIWSLGEPPVLNEVAAVKGLSLIASSCSAFILRGSEGQTAWSLYGEILLLCCPLYPFSTKGLI